MQIFQVMEIAEIKSRLTLSQVLHYYHLKPDKQLRLNCPFHETRPRACRFIIKPTRHIVLAAIARPTAKALT